VTKPSLAKNSVVSNQEQLTEERKRLAHLLGRLLARYWLRSMRPAHRPRRKSHKRSGRGGSTRTKRPSPLPGDSDI
jgi:hypothetical protein